jgi:hypothetical protein
MIKLTCAGHPYCTTAIASDAIVCRRCHMRMVRSKAGRRLISEFLAIRRRFPSRSARYKLAERSLTTYLHQVLDFTKRKADNIREFTIVR